MRDRKVKVVEGYGLNSTYKVVGKSTTSRVHTLPRDAGNTRKRPKEIGTRTTARTNSGTILVHGRNGVIKGHKSSTVSGCYRQKKNGNMCRPKSGHNTVK